MHSKCFGNVSKIPCTEDDLDSMDRIAGTVCCASWVDHTQSHKQFNAAQSVEQMSKWLVRHSLRHDGR